MANVVLNVRKAIRNFLEKASFFEQITGCNGTNRCIKDAGTQRKPNVDLLISQGSANVKNLQELQKS